MPNDDPLIATATNALRQTLSDRLQTGNDEFLFALRESIDRGDFQKRFRDELAHSTQADVFQTRVREQLRSSPTYREVQRRIQSELDDAMSARWSELRPFQRATLSSLVTATLTRELSNAGTLQSALERFARIEIVETVGVARAFPADSVRERRRLSLRSAVQESRLIALRAVATEFEVPVFQLEPRSATGTALANAVRYDVGSVNQLLSAQAEPWAALSWWTSWNPRLQVKPIELVGSDSLPQLQSAARASSELVG